MRVPMSLTRSSRCLLALAAILSGCETETVATKPEDPKVTVAHPEERTLTDFDTYNGWSDTSALVEVRSRVRGHIHKVHFVDGQMVKQDDPLFDLDPRPFQSEIDRAKDAVLVAKAQRESALKEEERQLSLQKQQATIQQDVDKAIAARKTWDAQVTAAEEEVSRRELELDYARIVAPISGKIGRAMMKEGNLVNAGGSDPLLTTIVAIDPIYVYFAVDERALLRYRENNPPPASEAASNHPVKDAQIPFEFRLETDEGFKHQGLLDFSDNRIDPATGTIQVRGASPNPDGKFLPGSRVRVRVPVSKDYAAILVPDEAVLSDQDQKYLLVLNPENRVIRRNVRLGRQLEDGMRVILPGPNPNEGIAPQDWVIVQGLQRARINYPVQPMGADGEPILTGAAATASVQQPSHSPETGDTREQ